MMIGNGRNGPARSGALATVTLSHAEATSGLRPAGNVKHSADDGTKLAGITVLPESDQLILSCRIAMGQSRSLL